MKLAFQPAASDLSIRSVFPPSWAKDGRAIRASATAEAKTERTGCMFENSLFSGGSLCTALRVASVATQLEFGKISENSGRGISAGVEIDRTPPSLPPTDRYINRMLRPDLLLQPTPKGLYCPPGDFYLDPVRGAVDRAVISHGHSDHARGGHGKVLAHPHTLAIMAAQGRDVKLDPARIAGYRNFGTKLWNATRFAEMNGVARDPGFAPETAADPVNRWILAELTRTANAVTQAVEAYRFNDAAGAAYRFVWNQVCDWYLELLKPVFNGEDEKAKAEARACAAHVLDETYKLLHPFMPFITEELWDRTASREGLLCHAAWPQPSFEDDEASSP